MRNESVGAQSFAMLNKTREILQGVKMGLLGADLRDDLHELRHLHPETDSQRLVDEAIADLDLALIRLRQASAAVIKSRSLHLGATADEQLPAWLRAAARARAADASGKTAKR